MVATRTGNENEQNRHASGISSANATSSRGGSERLSSASTQRLHIHLNHEVTQAHQAISSSLPVMEAGLVRAQLELYAEEQANMLYRGKDDNSGSVETTTGDATASAVAQWQPEFDQKDKSANIASRVWCPEIDTVTRPSKNPPSWIPEVHCEGKSAPAGPIPAGLVAERRLQRGVHAPRTRNAIQVQQPTLHPAEEPANCRAENPAQKPVSNDLGDFQHDNRPSHLSDLALRIGESRPRQQDEGPFNSARWSQDEMLTPSTCPNSADDPWMDAEPQRPYNSNPVISVQRNDAEATCVKNAEKQNAEVISVQGKDAEAEASDTKPEVDVAEAKATEIWTGLGGFGRRRETPGCNGRYPKCELKKSPHCALRVLHAQPTRVEFLFAVDLVKHENVTTLSHETVLKMKGRRIEMVQPNGTHVWLWGVHPPAIREIFTAFESMNTYQRQSTAHKLVDPPNVGFQGKSIEIPPSSARILRSQMASHHHPQHEDGCEVELGFAPAGTPHGGKSTPHSEFTSTVLRSALVQSDEPTCLHPEVSKDVKIESRGRQGDPCQAMKSLHRNRIIIPSLTGAKGKPFIPLLPLERLKEPEPFSMAQVSFHLSTPDSSDQLTGSSGAALDTADRNHFASNRLSSSTSEKVTRHTFSQPAGLKGYEHLSLQPPETPPRTSSHMCGPLQQKKKHQQSPISISTPAPHSIMQNSKQASPLPSHDRVISNSEWRALDPDQKNLIVDLNANFLHEHVRSVGRQYRSHVLRRIDPASALNVQLYEETRNSLLEMPEGAQLCGPQEMDEMIQQNEDSIQNAVVVM